MSESPDVDAAFDDQGPSLGELIALIIAGRDLDAAQAERAFTAVMSGNASPVQMAALLAVLRAKGEAPSEIAGGVRALRGAMIPVPVAPGTTVVDTCGTGGGALVTFNISTAAALVAAAGGAVIAKHGNRSFTSRCGSADVLEALGVRIDLSAEAMGAVLERTGIVFMFAPLLHPAMRHVGPVRRELAIPTIMNLLGPLTNPAGARRQVVGVSEPGLLELVAGGLRELEHEHALVVHGEPGLDELSPIGPTTVVEVLGDRIERHVVRPSDFGWGDLDPAELAGGDPAQNAVLIREILAGGGAPAARAAVALNAGAALYVAGAADSLGAGVARSEELLLNGAAMDRLEALRTASREAGA
jgi:anthranilate phosphoribosyltransferase